MTKTNGAILPIESVLEIYLVILEEYPGSTLSYQLALVCLEALMFFSAVFFIEGCHDHFRS